MVEVPECIVFCKKVDRNVLSVSDVANKGLAFAFPHGVPTDE